MLPVSPKKLNDVPFVVRFERESFWRNAVNLEKQADSEYLFNTEYALVLC